jgi:AcrR family transcriptional regulator
MAQRKSGGTRENLLIAASAVFMEKGFRNTTVAEICKRANANVSAVNYYFGSKEALYQEAWRHSFAESLKAHPVDGGVSETAPAAERLRGHVKALVERIADENNRDFFISWMEIVNPTGLLEEIIKSELIPLREKTLSLMRELLGAEATEKQVMFCETCLVSMCVHPMLMRRVQKRAKDLEEPFPLHDLEAFVDHVVKFVLAGIAAIRNDSAMGDPSA